MPYCAICRKSIVENIKVFRVPKDPEKKRLWEESTGFTFGDNCRICEKHFEASDWKWTTNKNRAAKRRLLMPNAIPKKTIIYNEILKETNIQGESQFQLDKTECINKEERKESMQDSLSEVNIIATRTIKNADIVSVPDFVSATTDNAFIQSTPTPSEIDPLAEEHLMVALCTQKEVQRKCRTCSRLFIVDENAKNLCDDKNTTILYHIAVITGIWIQFQDGISPVMCSICASDLRTAIEFRDICIQTELQLAGEEHLPVSTVIKEDNTTYGNIEEVEPQSFSDNDTREVFISANEAKSEYNHTLGNESNQHDIQKIRRVATRSNRTTLFPTQKPVRQRQQRHGGPKPKPPKRTLEEKNRLRREQIKALPLNHVCDQCGASFRLSWNLSIHMLRHTRKKNYKCPECHKEFYDAYMRNIHVRVVHKGELPFACNYCSKAFNSSTTRYLHEKNDHGASPRIQRNVKKQQQPTGTVRHYCTQCDKSYATKNALNGHINMHIGITPFKCKFCDMSFANPQLKKRHEMKHDKKRPFECDVCLKGFYDRSKLKEHCLIHTGERPYRCDVCDAYFRYKYNLYSHQFSKIHKDNLQKAQRTENVEEIN